MVLGRSVVVEEQVEYTRGEKILAFGLVAFLLVGGVKALEIVGNIVEKPDWGFYADKYGVNLLEEELEELRFELRFSGESLSKAREEFATAYEEYLFMREEYRVTLEEGGADPGAEQGYETAKLGYETAKKRLGVAEQRYDEVRLRVEEKEKELREARERASGEYGAAMRLYRFKVLGVHLALVLPLLMVSILVWNFARKLRTRFMIHANSLLAFSLLMFGYTVITFVWKAVHIVGVSVFGALACGLALAYLKKELLTFEKVSMGRVNRGECPWCGFTGFDKYCVACGRKILDDCPECGKPRSVMAVYCPNCGAKLR
ncbi:MAG: hypothetical protein DRO11_01980 [Methanobacteriota archaeon]|nr:MAG: hypothetical protein DRO11_01980 [Euryarchaeota archaeon]